MSTVTMRVGQTASIKLVFKDASGNVVLPPASGGMITRNLSISGGGNVGKVCLDPDQETVHYEALVVGTETLTYSIVAPSGTISATQSISIVSTTASSVAFDSTTFTTPDPSPPPTNNYG